MPHALPLRLSPYQVPCPLHHFHFLLLLGNHLWSLSHPAPFLPLGFPLNVSSSERPPLTAHPCFPLLLFPPALAPSSGKCVNLDQSHWILLTVHFSLQIPSSMKPRTFCLYEFLYAQPLAWHPTHCRGANTFAELDG